MTKNYALPSSSLNTILFKWPLMRGPLTCQVQRYIHKKSDLSLCTDFNAAAEKSHAFINLPRYQGFDFKTYNPVPAALRANQTFKLPI